MVILVSELSHKMPKLASESFKRTQFANCLNDQIEAQLRNRGHQDHVPPPTVPVKIRPLFLQTSEIALPVFQFPKCMARTPENLNLPWTESSPLSSPFRQPWAQFHANQNFFYIRIIEQL